MTWPCCNWTSASHAIPFAVSALLAREMLKPRKITTVTTLHGTDITLVGVLPSFQKVTQFSINHSDGVTAVSQWLKQQTLDSFEITKPVEVITNFLDTQVFRPRQDLRYRCRMAPKGEKIVMHISNFRPVKNVETVVRVFARLREHHDARLIFIGEGPEQMRAEQLAHARRGSTWPSWAAGVHRNCCPRRISSCCRACTRALAWWRWRP
jgi:N-acetyl-alpha-D-glucosaminyl L-malate synthase BshA